MSCHYESVWLIVLYMCGLVFPASGDSSLQPRQHLPAQFYRGMFVLRVCVCVCVYAVCIPPVDG